MNRPADIRTYADLQAQLELERLLAARRAKQTAARELCLGKLSTPAQPEPVNFCAETGADIDAPLPAMLLSALICLIAWGVFGWAVVAVIEALS